jgi:hypothetical protein
MFRVALQPRDIIEMFYSTQSDRTSRAILLVEDTKSQREESHKSAADSNNEIITSQRGSDQSSPSPLKSARKLCKFLGVDLIAFRSASQFKIPSQEHNSSAPSRPSSSSRFGFCALPLPPNFASSSVFVSTFSVISIRRMQLGILK